MSYLESVLLIHVVISMIALGAGFAVMAGFVTNRPLALLTHVFLANTVATSATGFLFPFDGFKPSYVFAVLSLILLGVAYYARYTRRMADPWRATFIATAIASQYLNFFVFVAQAFNKAPSLNAIAPTQSSPVFLISELVSLVVFVAFAFLAVKRFRPLAA
jgi:hypothetical protein